MVIEFFDHVLFFFIAISSFKTELVCQPPTQSPNPLNFFFIISLLFHLLIKKEEVLFKDNNDINIKFTNYHKNHNLLSEQKIMSFNFAQLDAHFISVFTRSMPTV